MTTNDFVKSFNNGFINSFNNDNDNYILTRDKRLAMANTDKASELIWFIDKIARNSDDAGMWNYKTVEFIFAPDGKFDFKIYQQPQPARINYNEYYSRFGTPKPAFLASRLAIKDVIFNPPATIVFWNDGTKTVVKAQNEAFDWEKGLAMAICKKYLAGGKSRYYDIFRKYEEAGVDAAYKEAIKSLVTRDLLI